MSKLKWAVVIGLVPAVVGFVVGCNSSSSGSSAGADTKTAQTVKSASKLASVLLSAGPPPPPNWFSVTTSGASHRSVNAALGDYQKAQARRVLARTANLDSTIACTSGTATPITNGFAFDKCVMDLGSGVTSYQDGQYTLLTTTSGTTSSTTAIYGSNGVPLVVRYSGVVNNTEQPKEEWEMLGSFMSADTDPQVCTNGGTGNASSTLNETLTMRIKSYKDGAIESDESYSASNVELVALTKAFDSDCNPTDATTTFSGKSELTDHINATNDSSWDGSFTVHETTTTATNGDQTISDEFNGTLAVKDACVNVSLVYHTVKPIVTIVPFGSTDTTMICPIQGELAITGDFIATIGYTATGGVTIDAGSNGSIDKTYASCTDAHVCN
jgi:hypothetical protein